MPIYEYHCKACNQIIEEIQKFSDPPLKTCPTCGSKVKKLMSMNSFHLKGSGWYVTDYASKKTTPPAPKNDKAEKISSGSEGTGSTESKATESKTTTTD